MLPRSANSASPPASASACSTPMVLRSGNAPGCPTMPVTYTRGPFTSCTITVTCGSRTSVASCFCTLVSSSCGVRPSAFTSPSNGSVILPSGLMGTVRERSGSFQTETSTTSSRLSRNSVMCLTSSSCTAAACEQPTATAAIAIQIPTLLDMLPPPPPRGRDRGAPGARAMPAPSQLASGAPSAPFAVSGPARRAGAPPPSRRRQWRRVPRSGTRVLTRASAACSRRALAHFSLDAGPRGTVARESKGTHGDVPDDRGSSHRIRLRRLRAAPDDDRRAAGGAAPAALHGDHVPDRGEVVLGADAEEDAARGGAARGAARGLRGNPALFG